MGKNLYTTIKKPYFSNWNPTFLKRWKYVVVLPGHASHPILLHITKHWKASHKNIEQKDHKVMVLLACFIEHLPKSMDNFIILRLLLHIVSYSNMWLSHLALQPYPASIRRPMKVHWMFGWYFTWTTLRFFFESLSRTLIHRAFFSFLKSAYPQ